jgi:hypothetical protein
VSEQEKRDELLDALGRLISQLHVPRSMPQSQLVLGGAIKAYDDVRNIINDFGWSTPSEVTERLRRSLGDDD